jgi:hypothetical protein
MPVKNSADREILKYLQFLVEHANGCKARTCRFCASLQEVCEVMGNRLFSTDFYPETAKSAATHAVAAHETESNG